MDEADLLADTIAVLAAPGKLVAQGTPVALKSHYGQGYTIQTTFPPIAGAEEKRAADPAQLLERIRPLVPDAHVTCASAGVAAYHLNAKDPSTVHQVLEIMEAESKAGTLSSYSVLSTSIEDIFLGLMHANDDGKLEKSLRSSSDTPSAVLGEHDKIEKETEIFDSGELKKLKKFTKGEGIITKLGLCEHLRLIGNFKLLRQETFHLLIQT